MSIVLPIVPVYTAPRPDPYELPHMKGDMAWRVDGACAKDPNVTVDWFFPPDDRYSWATTSAKRVCAGCVVREDCLTHALRNNERGVWGGTTWRERQRIRRAA